MVGPDDLMKALQNMLPEPLRKQLEEMAQRAGEINKKLATREFTGEAGGGMVKVTINGMMTVRGVEISEDALATCDREMLEDLIAAAINSAIQNAKEGLKEEFADALGAPLPTLGFFK